MMVENPSEKDEFLAKGQELYTSAEVAVPVDWYERELSLAFNEISLTISAENITFIATLLVLGTEYAQLHSNEVALALRALAVLLSVVCFELDNRSTLVAMNLMAEIEQQCDCILPIRETSPILPEKEVTKAHLYQRKRLLQLLTQVGLAVAYPPLAFGLIGHRAAIVAKNKRIGARLQFLKENTLES